MRRLNTIALVFIVIVITLMASSVQAQQDIKMGVKGGLDLMNISGAGGVKSKLGFGVGGFVKFSTNNPQITIQPEVCWIQKGAKIDDDEEEESIDFTYIEIPVLFKYEPLIEGLNKPFFFAGPAFGLLLSAKSYGEDFKEYMKGTEFGLVFGAGMDFKKKEISYISIDARYTFGLTNILDIENDDDSAKNNVLYVGVSYVFSGK